MEIDGIPIEVEVAISSTLPVPVLLGDDVPELRQLIGASTIKDAPSSTADVLVVVTRAQAKQKLAEEIIRRETEVLTGAQPRSMDGLGQEDFVDVNPLSTRAPEIPATLSQDQRRSLRRQMGKDTNHTHSKSKGQSETLELSSGEL